MVLSTYYNTFRFIITIFIFLYQEQIFRATQSVSLLLHLVLYSYPLFPTLTKPMPMINTNPVMRFFFYESGICPIFTFVIIIPNILNFLNIIVFYMCFYNLHIVLNNI